nr:NADH dehydrogenase subunit 4 [Neoheterobothrium hirame]
MENQKFSWYVFTVGIVSGFMLIISQLGFSIGCNNTDSLLWGDFIIFDNVSYTLCLLVLVIIYLVLLQLVNNNKINNSLLTLSCVFAALCFCSLNSIVFWVCYELSIICILFLLYTDSPYSDRYMAGWYLTAYAFFGGVPMLAIIVYNGIIEGSFNYTLWGNGDNVCIIILIILFITKIPLIPFHVWLPIVHAEASTITSVCLSGYIMKLGLGGLIRFGLSSLDNNGLFYYYFITVLISTIFIFLSCLEESDFKRWLAMLSLSHIGVGVLCLFSPNYGNILSSLVFGLGHGVAASYFFLLIMFIGLIGGSRHINSVSLTSGWSMSNTWLFIIGFCLCASFPPFMNFFIEVWLVGSYSNDVYWYLILLVYLFFSSLIPFSVLGLTLTRRFNNVSIQPNFINYICYFYLLLIGLIVSIL